MPVCTFPLHFSRMKNEHLKIHLSRHAQDSYSLALITVGNYITERKGPFSWTQSTKNKTTRMHSSRMRTARSSSRPGGLHKEPPLGTRPAAGPDTPWDQAPPRDQTPPWYQTPKDQTPKVHSPPVDRHTPVNI